MGSPDSHQKKTKGLLHGFSPAEPPQIFWNSRKRTANGRPVEKPTEEIVETPNKTEDVLMANSDNSQDATPPLSDRRKALFEPLEPVINNSNKQKLSNEMLLPPPDFDSTTYPKGWLIGKKRKLVNVDVVESMRRIAVQEMNRKDREIDGLNEQLEEDSRCLEHLQVQLLEERSKRAQVEREKAMLQNQVSMLMNLLQESEEANDIPTDDS
ncbi:protein HEADING DATE REPRESSOR 1-like [Aristolochia californica]|uniref:protein HEADING DATE REPRESSOR 1-like n=1 Tax=Aristolochia californica TaxID=171875 RepID=UPI0035E2F6BC